MPRPAAGGPGRRRATLLSRFVYSPANYWASLVGDTLMPVALLTVGGWSARSGGASARAAVLALLAGWLFWTLLEYVLHRWILHGARSLAQEGHAEHHRDERQLLATPMFFIPVVEIALWWLLARALGPAQAGFLVAGAAAGYASFSLLHHVFHHVEPEQGLLGRLRDAHEVHHRLARWNYGTTTSLWDRVFGTYRSPGSVPGIAPARGGR